MARVLNSLSHSLTEFRVLPGYTPADGSAPKVSLESPLCLKDDRAIMLHIPFLSAAMQAVTGTEMAIALAQLGGIGILPVSQPVEEQCDKISRVKRFKGGFQTNILTLGPDQKIRTVIDIINETGYTTFPVTTTGEFHARLVGILTDNVYGKARIRGIKRDRVLGELDEALTMYDAFEGFDEQDLAGTMNSIQMETDRLPQRYSDLWDLFKEVKNSYDEEAYEQLLADDEVREEFYARLSEYSKTLAIALSSEKFIVEVQESTLEQYKTDLKRFHKLRVAVKMRYAESIDYRDYEPKIKKLLDTHIQANEAIQLNEPVNIFDESSFGVVKEEQGVYTVKKTDAAQADAIAHATKKVITEKMEEDPAFYSKFSKLIQDAIDEFRAKLISGQEYLQKVSGIREKVVTRKHDDAPEGLAGHEDAMAYFGVIKPLFGKDHEEAASEAALAIERILEPHIDLVDFWDNDDAQKRAINEIDDYLFDEVRGTKGIDLSYEQMDTVIESTLRIARHRTGK